MDISQFRTVDWVADAETQNKVRLARSPTVLDLRRFLAACQSWFVLAVSGTAVGLIAVVLTLATGWLSDLREGHCQTSWYLNEAGCCFGQSAGCSAWKPHASALAYPAYVILAVLLAGLASFLVVNASPLAAGSGISEIKCIVQGFRAPQFLSRSVLAVKCIALPLVIASGLSVGKEGPSVHYAACVSHILGSKLVRGDQRKHSDLITAGCAAGVAVAFGSPVGGLLFGIEEIAAELNVATIWRIYFCCLVATSVVSVFNPFRTGQLVLFSVQYDGTWHSFDLPFIIGLGVFGGVVGKLIIKINLRIAALRKKYWAQRYLAEVCMLALVTGLVGYFNQYLRTDMTKSMQTLFHECEHGGETQASCQNNGKLETMLSLLAAAVLRIALLLVSYGAGKVPAGIFVPSLAAGALFGRFVGTFVWYLHDRFPTARVFASCTPDAPCVNPGAYALLGAGALLSGVMHITLTVVVVMFELTGATNYIIPTMIVVGVTKFVANRLGEGGIADMAIKQNHLPLIDSEIPAAWENALIKDIMIPRDRVVAVPASSPEPPTGQRFQRYPIVDEKGGLAGVLTSTKIDKSPIMVLPTDTVAAVNTIFLKLGPQCIYVVESTGRLAGLISRKGLVEALKPSPVRFTPTEEKVGAMVGQALQAIEQGVSKIIPAKLRGS